MNLAQARSLAALLEAAVPMRRWDDDPEPEIHCSIESTGGDDYEIRLWSPNTYLVRYPTVYIDKIGRWYTWDSELDKPQYVDRFEWRPHAFRQHDFVFTPVYSTLSAA